MEQQYDRAYRVMVGWVLAKTSGQKQGVFRKKSAPLTGLELERTAAAVIGRTNTWVALRDAAGLDPIHLPASDRDRYLEEQAVEWAGRLTDEYPTTGLDKARLQMRVRFNFIGGTGIFTGTNALRASAERFARDGSISELQYGARMARASLESAARSMATLDVASLTLGSEDAQITEKRAKMEQELAELGEMIERTRPLLEAHGIGADWLP